MVFVNLFARSCHTARFTAKLRHCAPSRIYSNSLFSTFVVDMDVYRVLASTDKAMADSFLLNQIAMKEETMKWELREKDEATMLLKDEALKSELRGKVEALKSELNRKNETMRLKKEDMKTILRCRDVVIKAKDETMRLKEEDMKTILRCRDVVIKAKEEDMKTILRCRDEVSKAKDETISSYKYLIDLLNKEHEKEIIKKNLELCQIKGLVNLKSMFEMLIRICVSEQKQTSRDIWETISEKIDYILSLKGNEAKGKYTKELQAAVAEHGYDLHDFDATLYNSIISEPWNNHSIRVYIKQLSKTDRMLAERIVALFELKEVHLEVPEIAETSDSNK